jgi:hypothetical protein
LALVFVISASTVAIVRPEVFVPRTAAPTVEDPSVLATRLQATVDYLVILGSSDQPTGLPPAALETQVVVSAMQTIQAAAEATPTACGDSPGCWETATAEAAP